MDTKITFKELARKNKMILEKQQPVTYDQALQQVKRLREQSKIRNMKICDSPDDLKGEDREIMDKAVHMASCALLAAYLTIGNGNLPFEAGLSVIVPDLDGGKWKLTFDKIKEEANGQPTTNERSN